MKFPEINQDRVLPEIQYYISFCLLKRLFEQGKITLAACQKANTLIAEKYGVLSYDVDKKRGETYDDSIDTNECTN